MRDPGHGRTAQGRAGRGQIRSSTRATTCSSPMTPTVRESTPSAALSDSTHQPSGLPAYGALDRHHTARKAYDDAATRPRPAAVQHQQPVAVTQGGQHRPTVHHGHPEEAAGARAGRRHG